MQCRTEIAEERFSGLSHRLVTLPYAVLAAMWIGLTDMAVMALVADSRLITLWQIGKGWVFVATTSILLAFLVHRTMSRHRDTSSERDEYIRRLTTLVGNLQGIVYRCRNDEKWTMERIDGDVCDLTGYQPAELIGNQATAFADIIHPDDRQMVRDQVQHAIEERRPFKLRYRIVTRTGQTRWMAEQGCDVRDPKGKVLGLEGYIHDVTDLTEFERSMHNVDKMNLLERVVGCAAHDFNNYLTAICGSAELLADEVGHDSGPAREELDAIFQASQAAIGLSRKLLTFSRFTPPTRERIDLVRFVHDREDMFRSIVRRSAQLELKFVEGPAFIRANPGEVDQVLTNVILNAADAAEGGGRVVVEIGVVEGSDCGDGWGEAETFVRLRVTDDGVGMDEETKQRLFEPFFTTKGEHGTGLGLASVHGIVKELSGHILVDSTPGHGCRFDIYFPHAEQAREASRSGTAA